MTYFLYTDTIITTLAESARLDINNEWEDVVVYGVKVEEPQPEENDMYLTNLHGTLIKDLPGINTYFVPFYDTKPLSVKSQLKYIKHPLTIRFANTINYLKTLSGVRFVSIFCIGPKSVLPIHIDDESRPAFSPSSDRNVVIGLEIPSEDTNYIGVDIGGSVIGQKYNHALVFDSNVPHSAWNNTGDWWATLILHVDPASCKDSRYLGTQND